MDSKDMIQLYVHKVQRLIGWNWKNGKRYFMQMIIYQKTAKMAILISDSMDFK